MCLIAVAPSGTNKYDSDFLNGLRVASTTNKDGIGFAFKRSSTGKVFISKGFDEVEDAIEAIKSKKLKDADELVVHLRIGNRGSVNVDMCHPFVLADNATDILANKTYVNSPVMAHNGTFFGYGNTSTYSDTFQFVQDFMHHPLIIELLKTDRDFFVKVFKDTIKSNKLAFLFPNCNNSLELIGDFTEDDGYFYSNRSYKNSNYRNVGGVERFVGHNSHYDDYYDDDYYQNCSVRHNSKYDHWNQKRAAEAVKKVREISDDLISDDDNIDDNYVIPRKVDVVDRPNLKIVKPLNNTIKSGFRVASDDEISIKTIGNYPAFKDHNGTSYYEVLGLYIPYSFNRNDKQFDHILIKPSFFNYPDLILKGIKVDSDYGIERSCFYHIVDVGDNEEYFTIVKVFSLVGQPVKFLSVPALYMNELFQAMPRAGKLGKYKDYYRLVRDINHNFTSMIKIARFIGESEEYSKGESFDVSGVNGIRRESLDLFKYNLARENRGSDQYVKFINNRLMF